MHIACKAAQGWYFEVVSFVSVNKPDNATETNKLFLFMTHDCRPSPQEVAGRAIYRHNGAKEPRGRPSAAGSRHPLAPDS